MCGPEDAVNARTTVAACWTLLGIAAGCAMPVEEQDQYFEGVAFDEENPYAALEVGKADGTDYEMPTDVPELVAPEIIVSLDQLTLHLFDRVTGFSEVYPIGVGVLNSAGVSITPTGHFTTSPDTSDAWWYTARRKLPAYFGGYPFIRITAKNSRGSNTYGLHGPITRALIRSYVSHGCVRIGAEDVVRIFYAIRNHPATPVTIQREAERDAAGAVVDLDSEVALWAVGEIIAYGDSVGDAPPRSNTGMDADGCADDRLESPSPWPIGADRYAGLVLCPGDVDDYAIELDARGSLTVSVEVVGATAPLVLTLEGPAGVKRAGVVAGTATLSVDAQGSYRVSVSGGGGTAAVYALVAERSP